MNGLRYRFHSTRLFARAGKKQKFEHMPPAKRTAGVLSRYFSAITIDIRNITFS